MTKPNTEATYGGASHSGVEAFEQLADFFGEPLMLVDVHGGVLAANRPAHVVLDAGGQAPGVSILGRAANAESFGRYLQRAARTTGPSPGILHLIAGDGSRRSLRCNCGRILMGSTDASGRPDKVLLLRCMDKVGADRHFTELNRQIDSLRREVAARQQAEEALRKSERRFHGLFEAAPDATLIFNQEGLVVLTNEVLDREFGYERGVLVGGPVEQLLQAESSESSNLAVALFTPFKTNASSALGALLGVKQDGETIPIDARLRPIETEEGRVVVAALRDRRDHVKAERRRRELEHKMLQAQKLESLGILAGGIAHDFNNLLLGVMGNAELILMEEPASEAIRTHAHDIVTSAEHAADLCKQLLAYSGRGQFIIKPAALTDMVREMAQLLDVSIHKKNTLQYDFADDLPLVEVDHAQIRQVIMNLIINASDAIGDAGGTITIRTGRMECDEAYLSRTHIHANLQPGPFVFVEITDSGCGIQETDIARIFDPFFTTKSTGRGLGLAAVLGIVRSHRGALKVYSEPGIGTTFKVLLPEGSQSVLLANSTPKVELGWRGQGTVLLIEDEEAVRAITAKILRRHGFEVVTAENGRVGLDVLQVHREAVVAVVLDMTMPVLNGEETLQILRASDPDLPVILASGYSKQSAPMRAEDDRALRFVQKPFRVDDLMRTLRALLEEPKMGAGHATE